MDEIRIEGLEVYAGHGVFEEERRNGQPFLINAVLYTDVRQAGINDDLTLSTNYGEVSCMIDRFLRQSTFQLIETLAERTAEKILLQFPRVKAVELEIKKPKAPIGLPFESVSVKICRGWKKAYLGIGSNMGDKKGYMEEALIKLENNKKIRNMRVSSFIVTQPYGGVEQDEFLNGAVELETLYTPWELLCFLQSVEKEAGRTRDIHWGPRTLDLDILFYEDFLCDFGELTVPHPDMQNRDFVLKPLNELCPYKTHPIFHKSVRQMLEELIWKGEN